VNVTTGVAYVDGRGSGSRRLARTDGRRAQTGCGRSRERGRYG